MSEWISVKDQMPENRQYVDILVDGRYRKTDYEYEGDGVFYEDNYDITYSVGSVTHWMPLPKPPVK
jgi:hypothetical protein